MESQERRPDSPSTTATDASDSEVAEQQPLQPTQPQQAHSTQPTPRTPTAARVSSAASTSFPAASTASSSSSPVLDLSLSSVTSNTLAHIRSSPACHPTYGAATQSLFGLLIGIAIGTAIQWILLCGESWRQQFGLYLMALALFHALEYGWTAIFHPHKLTAESYLLNHSREYHLALAAGVLEFLVESYFFPSLKASSSSSSLPLIVMMVGTLMTLGGQLTRTVAMLTAADNFTHIVAESKRESHQLVTHGIYSLCRHPSYAGWFWWSVGTQLILCNPLCTLAYAFVSFKFFQARVAHEERALLSFFGRAYAQYQQRVPTGVPFVKGFL